MSPFSMTATFVMTTTFIMTLSWIRKTPIYIVCLTQNHIKNEGTKVIMKQPFSCRHPSLYFKSNIKGISPSKTYIYKSSEPKGIIRKQTYIHRN